MVTGTFEIRAAGRLDLKVTDVQGQPSTETFSAPISVLTDERPFVRLLEPRAVSFATPAAHVPVVISGEDDYGISRVQLFRNLNNSRYLPQQVPVASPSPVRTYDVVVLPLSQYGLKPGDEIKLFARVDDNDPATGVPGAAGKGAESTIVVIRIISQDDFDQMRRTRDGLEMLTSKYREVARRMEALAKDLEELKKKTDEKPADDKLSDEQRKQLEELTERLQKEMAALEKIRKQELPYDVDKELDKQLEKLAKSLKELAEQPEKLAKDKNARNREMAQSLEKMLESLRQQNEQLDKEMTEPLQLLESVYRLKADESRYVNIYQRQRDLAERLKSFKEKENTDDPAMKARMRELEEERRALPRRSRPVAGRHRKPRRSASRRRRRTDRAGCAKWPARLPRTSAKARTPKHRTTPPRPWPTSPAPVRRNRPKRLPTSSKNSSASVTAWGSRGDSA